MITEEQVVEAYRKHLRLEVRKMIAENTGVETIPQGDERIDAAADLSEIHLQYLSQHVA